MIAKRTAGRPLRALSAPLLCGLLAGCGGRASVSSAVDETAGVESTIPAASTVTTPAIVDAKADDRGRLSTAQALLLSRALVKNEEVKGAIVAVTVPFGPAATFTLTGPVDWAGDRAALVLSTKRSDGVAVPNSPVFWDRGAILTEVDGLPAAMAAKGRSGVRFVARAMNPKGVSLDQLITFVGSLAVDRAENPILIRQADTAFVGTKVIDGITVEGYRYAKTKYWIDPSTGLLREVEARFARYNAPVLIALSGHGPQSITLPPTDQVVDGSTIPDVLAELKPTPTPTP